MAPRIDDRWMWLGFTAFFIIAAKGLRYAIRDTIELTRVHPSHYEDESTQSGEQPEDTISLENLRVLAESPNFNISESAIAITVSRFSKLSDAGNLLNKDLTSDNEDVRKRARIAAQFLRDNSVSLKELPRSPPRSHRTASIDSFSTVDDIPSGRTLSAAELARLLYGGAGGVDGGNAWVGEFIPTAADPVAGWTDVPRERPVEGDGDEAETRRRRREAMVLHEGVGALREDDIIRPRN